MRRILVIALALATFVTTACSDRQASPTEPAFQGPAVVSACPSANSIRQQITRLFPLGNGLILAQAAFEVIVIKLRLGRTAEAQNLTNKLIIFTTKQFNAGALRRGTTSANVADFNSALTCFAGITPSGATEVAVAVVDPSQTTPTTLVAPSLQAGIQVKPTDVNQPTVVAVYSLPVADTLLTNLDKYPPNYQFTTSGGEFNTPVLIGLCPSASETIFPRLKVAHNVPDPNPTGIEILPSVDPGPLGLSCTPVGLRRDSRIFAVRQLQHLGREIGDLLSPAPLFAATLGTTGIGGTTKKLSVFGAVDPVVVPFQSSGWFYKQISNFDPVPSTWTTIAPTVDSGWTPGTAAFGTTGCSLPAPSTPWTLNTTMLLRRDVFVPLGTASMTIDVLIDNDLFVFVNGTNLTGGGLFNENCADTHPIHITVNGPDSEGPLVPGQVNKIFIRGVDRGGQSYLDAKITFVSAP